MKEIFSISLIVLWSLRVNGDSFKKNKSKFKRQCSETEMFENNSKSNSKIGLDCYSRFLQTHHLTDKATKLLPKYFIREAVVPRKLPLTFEPNGFFSTFKRRALEALKDVNFHQPSTKTNLIADFLFTSSLIFSILTAYTQSYLMIVFTGW